MIVASKAKSRVTLDTIRLNWNRETRTFTGREYDLTGDGFNPEHTDSFALVSETTGRPAVFVRLRRLDTPGECVYVCPEHGVELVIDLMPWCRD